MLSVARYQTLPREAQVSRTNGVIALASPPPSSVSESDRSRERKGVLESEREQVTQSKLIAFGAIPGPLLNVVVGEKILVTKAIHHPRTKPQHPFL